MKIKTSFGERCFDVFNTVFMTFLIIIMLYPMLYVAFASFSDSNLLQRHDGLLFAPLGFNLEAYKKVIMNPMILTGYANTLWVLVVGTLCSIITTVLTAYVLSRKNFKAAKFMMKYILVTMYFGGGLVPFYLTVKRVGLYGSLWALILPGLVSSYNLIVMRTAFSSIPDSLEEAAKIDGAGHLTILFRIVLPLSTATIAVVILYYAVAYWNAWFGAMIYLRDRAKYPLQLVMREILIQNDTSSMTTEVGDSSRASVSESIKYAVVIIGTLPILMVYPMIQKHFVKGVMLGAVKG